MTGPAGPPPFGVVAGRVRLALRLVPRAGRNGLDCVAIDAEGRPALKLRLAAPPVDGAANKALIAYLAEGLAVRKADVTIRSGETSRHKIVEVSGDVDTIQARLKAWIASS
ncbi:MAG: DUF167 domain-containing protein [Caulobacteraceae bacterium]